MQVKILKTGKLRSMHPKVAQVLQNRGLVVIVPDVPQPFDSDPVEEQAPAVEISPRTGLPKRTYTRRDLKAEG